MIKMVLNGSFKDAQSMIIQFALQSVRSECAKDDGKHTAESRKCNKQFCHWDIVTQRR